MPRLPIVSRFASSFPALLRRLRNAPVASGADSTTTRSGAPMPAAHATWFGAPHSTSRSATNRLESATVVHASRLAALRTRLMWTRKRTTMRDILRRLLRSTRWVLGIQARRTAVQTIQKLAQKSSSTRRETVAHSAWKYGSGRSEGATQPSANVCAPTALTASVAAKYFAAESGHCSGRSATIPRTCTQIILSVFAGHAPLLISLVSRAAFARRIAHGPGNG